MSQNSTILPMSPAPSELVIPRKELVADKIENSKRPHRAGKIWIDFDNSPHVPFFLPIIEELQKQGYCILLTARDAYQVCELLRFHNLACRVVGHHWGKHRVFKVIGTCLRTVSLIPLIIREKPALALSHGSRAQIFAGLVLHIPIVTLMDYEFASTLRLFPDWILAPDLIPDSKELVARRQVLKYPGLKEDVYVPSFKPDPAVKSQLGLMETDLVVTVRPPASEAHYHNPESDLLFDGAMKMVTQHPDTRVVLLPRNRKQDEILRKQWQMAIGAGKVIIPECVLDGLNLIWFSDLVISGGGTMNREAAALGVPVYSIFRGKIGAVDRHLAEQGRLTLIESVDELRTRIALVHRNRPPRPDPSNRPTLHSIVSIIVAILESLLSTSRRNIARRRPAPS